MLVALRHIPSLTPKNYGKVQLRYEIDTYSMI